MNQGLVQVQEGVWLRIEIEFSIKDPGTPETTGKTEDLALLTTTYCSL